jgi:hypothetical protein
MSATIVAEYLIGLGSQKDRLFVCEQKDSLKIYG